MFQIINHIQILKVPVQTYRRLVVSLTRARACHLSLQQSNILYSFRYLWHSSRRGIFLLSPDSQRGHANPSLIIILWHKTWLGLYPTSCIYMFFCLQSLHDRSVPYMGYCSLQRTYSCLYVLMSSLYHTDRSLYLHC